MQGAFDLAPPNIALSKIPALVRADAPPNREFTSPLAPNQDLDWARGEPRDLANDRFGKGELVIPGRRQQVLLQRICRQKIVFLHSEAESALAKLSTLESNCAVVLLVLNSAQALQTLEQRRVQKSEPARRDDVPLTKRTSISRPSDRVNIEQPK